MDDLSHAAILATMDAGALLKKGFGTTLETASKKNIHDLVTQYDRLSQEKIIDFLQKRFPSHAFLGEENPKEFTKLPEILWIIDPLDGTVNFAHSIPFFAVSIAVAIGGKVVCGVVYNPIGEELFTAQKGMGAYLNGRKLQVSSADKVENAFMATGFPYNVSDDPLHCIEQFATIARQGGPIRRLGAASLDLSYVAAGRFDAFWEVGLHPWDIAAGKLLIEEAGGKVTHYDGSEHRLFGYLTALATNGKLHAPLKAFLKGGS